EEARRLFDTHGSPMALLAGYFLAEAARDTGDAARSASILRDVSERTSSRYLALRAFIQWSSASAAARAGLPKEALESFRAASATFSALGEEQNASWMRDATLPLLAASGDSAEAW